MVVPIALSSMLNVTKGLLSSSGSKLFSSKLTTQSASFFGKQLANLK